MEPDISPDLAGKVLGAEFRNVVKDVGEGGKLPTSHRRKLEGIVLTPDLAAQQRAAALLAKYCDGGDLTPAQWEEVRAVHPGFAAAPSPPTVAAAAAIVAASGRGPVKLSKADQALYETIYKKDWRTIYRWIERGEKAGDPCPLDDPQRLLHWWPKHFKWKPPTEVEAAAVEAARGAPSLAPAPTSEPPPQIPTSDPASPKAPVAAPVRSDATGDARSTAMPSPNKSVDLSSIDPEEGDRLRELKQLQVQKFRELKEAFDLGQETKLLEDRYVKMVETIDKIESRAIERAKKRGLYISREEVNRDLAKNAELLRQTRESMERRVLEQCPSLSADQRIEVSAAILRARQREDVMFSRLACLQGEDLLKELSE